MPFWYKCNCVLLSAMKGQGLIKSREGGVAGFTSVVGRGSREGPGRAPWQALYV